MSEDTPGDEDGSDRRDEGESDQADAPMADLARQVEAERDPPDPDEAFEAVETSDIDAEDVWSELEEGVEDQPVTTGEQVQGHGAGDVRIIPKRTCHTCPYFGEPPELHCTHEGTEIRSVASPEEFEVVDCPMVVDDDDLGGSP